jgi:hypothetical protein
MVNNLHMSGIIITLLLINTGYHINNQACARRYHITHTQLMELQLKNAGFVAINIMVCVCLVCLF